MKLFFLLAWVSLLTLSAQAENESWDEAGKKEDARLIQAIPEKYEKLPGASLLFEGKMKTENVDRLTCRLVNKTGKPIFFTGYGINSPWYRMQTWDGQKWVEYRVGWFCGTGLRSPELPSGKSAVFGFEPPRDATAYRVGITLIQPDHNSKPEEFPTIWTEKIELSKN